MLPVVSYLLVRHACPGVTSSGLCPPQLQRQVFLRTGLWQDDLGDLAADGAQHALRARQPPGGRLLRLLGPPLGLFRGGSRIKASTWGSRVQTSTVPIGRVDEDWGKQSAGVAAKLSLNAYHNVDEWTIKRRRCSAVGWWV